MGEKPGEGDEAEQRKYQTVSNASRGYTVQATQAQEDAPSDAARKVTVRGWDPQKREADAPPDEAAGNTGARASNLNLSKSDISKG